MKKMLFLVFCLISMLIFSNSDKKIKQYKSLEVDVVGVEIHYGHSDIFDARVFEEMYLKVTDFKLTDLNGNPIIGQHIALNLTRLSNGLNKVYWVTTDTNGEYQLEINLGAGSYTADCSYAGTSTYTSSSAHATLTVTA